MKRIIITGFSGFVSRHFLNYLYKNTVSFEVLGVDMNAPNFNLEKYEDRLKVTFKEVNLLDEDELNNTIKQFQPDYVLHLASISSVAYSWKNPAECFYNNTRIFLNLIDALRKNNLQNCRVLSVGSSEEYGNVSEEQLPLKEDMQLSPVNPYAVARVSQEMMAKVYVEGFGMNIILTRSFNHIGPYQDKRFVIPSFIHRILELKAQGLEEGCIEVGDITVVRDFLDVRDIVEAYYLLLIKGVPGEVYNICSGDGRELSSIIAEIADIVDIHINSKVNEAYLRPDECRKVIGSYEKINKAFGWEPKISLRQTLKDMIDKSV